jgi:hypothetical protein
VIRLPTAHARHPIPYSNFTVCGGLGGYRRASRASAISLANNVLSVAMSYAETSISAAEAAKHIGEKAIVCGKVASTHYAVSSDIRNVPFLVV